MKQLARTLQLMIIFLALVNFGCTPKYTYKDRIQNNALSSGETASTRVSASVEEWRNSGVIITENTDYKISAEGQWRTYPTCNFTGPDGIGLYKAWCIKTPLYPAIIEGFSHSTLIAKIGENGPPFVVGSEYQLIEPKNGTLFFRINDAAGGNHDNEGFVVVKIESTGKNNTRIPQPVKPEDSKKSTPEPVIAGPVQHLSPKLELPIEVLKPAIGERTALVIGNSDYEYSPLKNPVNDANSMAESLRKLGFDVVVRLNASQQQMESAIDKFGRKLLRGNQIGLFYYAGHGVQVDGENYLVPTDAVIKRQSDVRYKAVNIGQVLGTMGEAKDNLNIVILDACRDNPLPRSFRSASRGLARMEGPKGTIIGFATSPGSVAADGEGDNGIYTKHLLDNMQTPGLSIEQVFKKVLQGVNEETEGNQIPWTESSFTGDFSFIPNDTKIP